MRNNEIVFNSMGEFKSYYFPKAYEKEVSEKEIADKGLGNYLAERALETIKKSLELIRHKL